MIENKYVPYKESLEFKKLGFNEPCFGYYNNTGNFTLDLGKTNSDCNKMSMYDKYCTALLYQDAIIWLYEKYDIWIEVRKSYLPNRFVAVIKNPRVELSNKNNPLKCYKEAIKYVIKLLS